MNSVRTGLVMLAILGALIVAIATTIARDRAHQLPLGNGTMGQHTAR